MKFRPGARIEWLGRHKQILGEHKKFNAPNSRVWTKKQSFSARISTNSWIKTERKGSSSQKNARISTISGVEPQKNGYLLQNLRKQFLLTNSGVLTSILRVSCFELHSSGIEPLTFFGGQSLLGRAQFSFGRARLRNASPLGPGLVKSFFLIFTNRQKKTIYWSALKTFFSKLDEKKPRKQDTRLKFLPEVVKTSPLLSPSQPTFCCQGPTHARRLWAAFRGLAYLITACALSKKCEQAWCH